MEMDREREWEREILTMLRLKTYGATRKNISGSSSPVSLSTTLK